MERNTKRILAIILIVVIGVGAGVGIWWFIGRGPGYVTPGVSGIPEDQWIKVGCLGDTGEIQGDGNWEGAWLAAYEINTNGGINVNGTDYYVALISEDTDESNPQLETSRGVAAAEKIINVDKAEYIIGGFRTESLKAYWEVVMDNQKLFFGTGAATDYFCEQVEESYNRYKYFFRTMPINSSSLGLETIMFLLTLGPLINATYGEEIFNVAIIRENLDWTVPMYEALVENLEDNTVWNYSVVEDIAYPITATAEDFGPYWNQIETAGARLAIPIISAQGGIYMMKKYAELKPECMVAGIDVQSQSSTFWDDTDGDCVYETIMQPLTNVSKTPVSKDYWNAFADKWGHAPLYTATGAYDAMYLLIHAINETQAFDADTLIDEIETYDKNNPLMGMSPTGPLSAWWPNTHDIVEGWPYGVTEFAQWQDDGTKKCVPAPLVYPSAPFDLVPGSFWPSPWNYTLVESPFQVPDWFGW
ncbi:MAG: hypothetical protein EU548_06530 [Promethearchaeota archaeon]|nr:MAG: hypothetical protein EU548_06530 [Candidatus Lokiarchaeota archaeon]